MDEPEIRYTRTEDGVDIAYWMIGEGPPLIVLQARGVAHLALEWRLLGARESFERLATLGRVVRYSPRGSGLSDRDATNLSVEGDASDLEAVVAAIGDGPASLLGVGPGARRRSHSPRLAPSVQRS